MAQRRQQQPPQDKGLPKAVLGDRFVTTYDPSKALEIVERIAGGETLNAICKGVPGMPSPTTFKRWAVNNPDLAHAYTQALIISATALEEEALDTARAIALLPKDGTHVRAAEVKLGQLRWSAERRDPSKYGQKSQINVRVPVQIITPLDLGGGGGPTSADIYTIDVTPKPLLEEKPPTPELPDRTGPRKKVLTPRNPFYTYKDTNGKSKAVSTRVRPASDQPSDRGGPEGPGAAELHPANPALPDPAAAAEQGGVQEQTPSDGKEGEVT
jgi:hypothetical protein